MHLPNFVLIGAQKAGTTAIAHYLAQHPQIYMSSMKEPGFFDFEDHPPNFKGPQDQSLYTSVISKFDDYVKLFDAVTDEIAIGEATTWYLYSKRAPHRIKHYIPEAKLIVILRNPVDRAFSAYMHAIRDEREHLDFKAALEAENQRIAEGWEYLWHYKTISQYSQQLNNYFSIFNPNQIRIYLYEDLCNQPEALLEDIFDYLGVDQTFKPQVFTRLNISGKKKSLAIDELLKDKHPLKRFLKPLLPVKLRKQMANRVRILNSSRSECPQVIKRKLIEDLREDILTLQNLIDRDLSHWLT